MSCPSGLITTIGLSVFGWESITFLQLATAVSLPQTHTRREMFLGRGYPEIFHLLTSGLITGLLRSLKRGVKCGHQYRRKLAQASECSCTRTARFTCSVQIELSGGMKSGSRSIGFRFIRVTMYSHFPVTHVRESARCRGVLVMIQRRPPLQWS